MQNLRLCIFVYCYTNFRIRGSTCKQDAFALFLLTLIGLPVPRIQLDCSSTAQLEKENSFDGLCGANESCDPLQVHLFLHYSLKKKKKGEKKLKRMKKFIQHDNIIVGSNVLCLQHKMLRR